MENGRESNRKTIRNFSQVGKFLRHLFLYNCTASQIKKIGYGTRNVKYQVAILKDYFPPDTRIIKRQEREQTITFKSNMFDTDSNTLFPAYKLKSFGRTDMERALLYIQILNQHEAPMKAEDIEDEATKYLTENNTRDIRTVKNILEILEEAGYSVKCGKNQWKLSPDIFENISKDTFLRLQEAADFFSNIISPLACGMFLSDTLADYAESKGEKPFKSSFLMRDNHFVRILDDEMIMKICGFIHEGRQITFKYTDQAGNTEKDITETPFHILADEQMGRNYLLSYTPEDKISIRRIDRMSNLKEDTATDKDIRRMTPEEIQAFINDMFKNSFSGIQLPHDNLVTVILRVKNDYMRKALSGLIPPEKETLNEDGSYNLEFRLYEWRSLKPWLRRHMDTVKLIECSDPAFESEWNSELKEWRKLYGDLQ